jgi:type IV pilus assembly protein PilV
MTNAAPRNNQQGMSLLEGMLAILIFSVGILALVALQSTSVRATTDAKFRADAGFLANQLIAQMWTDFRPVGLPNDITTYGYNAGGANCAFGGGGGNANVNAWAAGVQATLPGSDATMQQVVVTPIGVAGTQTYMITVNICWQSGTEVRRFSTVTQMTV